jgi:hypothetical protein
MTGTHENIAVTSSPAGAEATLTCAKGETRTAATPYTFVIPRDSGTCELRVTKDGFEPRTVTLEQGVNGAYWRNFVTAPLVPVGIVGINGFLFDQPDAQSRTWGAASLLTVAAVFSIDYWNGAVREHTPTSIDLTLSPKGQ